MQLEPSNWRNNVHNEWLLMMDKRERLSYRCKRCNRPAGTDMICQSCKSELLANYEAACDWQTAFEIEKAAQTALRYREEEDEVDNSLYF